MFSTFVFRRKLYTIFTRIHVYFTFFSFDPTINLIFFIIVCLSGMIFYVFAPFSRKNPQHTFSGVLRMKII